MGDVIQFPAKRSCVDCIFFTEGVRGQYCVAFAEWLMRSPTVEARDCDAYTVPGDVA